MTKTELAIQYANRTWSDHFPDEVDDVLEKDYVNNAHLYTDEVLGGIRLLLLINPNASPNEIIEGVHSYLQDC